LSAARHDKCHALAATAPGGLIFRSIQSNFIPMEYTTGRRENHARR
jgi:hypothetical protein